MCVTTCRREYLRTAPRPEQGLDRRDRLGARMHLEFYPQCELWVAEAAEASCHTSPHLGWFDSIAPNIRHGETSLAPVILWIVILPLAILRSNLHPLLCLLCVVESRVVSMTLIPNLAGFQFCITYQTSAFMKHLQAPGITGDYIAIVLVPTHLLAFVVFFL
ncbi:hypothetical protein AVEN_40433-1 [Araneus ventricosus]|uniref:Uncharacterized protein n=1 Tax=Araneus ventricosus TaxID=182803 RepID=A0A4Y2TPK1_ARAVE|nr:hypothetical protein AVEN_40433-1 [Araneus ventricosus]